MVKALIAISLGSLILAYLIGIRQGELGAMTKAYEVAGRASLNH